MNTKEKKVLEKFLNGLLSPKDTVNITVLNDKKGEGVVKNLNAKGTKEILSKVLEFDKKKLGGICITPNPIQEGKKRGNENVKQLNAIFVDIDSNKLELDGLPTPHYVFKRTDKNFHLYWFIERLENNEKNRKTYSAIANALISRLGGDKAVKDVSRILRLPYTFYGKGGKEGKGYTLLQANDLPRYKLNELKVASMGNNEIEKFLLGTKPAPIEEGRGRSRFLYHFALNCFSWGIEKPRAIELAHNYNLKYCKPPEPERIVNHQVNSAYTYAKGTFGEYKILGEEEGNTHALKAFRDAEEIKKALDSFVYITESERLINMKTGLELTTVGQIENYIAHLTGKVITFKNTIRKGLVKVVDRMDFRPDKKRTFYKHKAVIYFNRFNGFKELSGKKNDLAVKVFTKHLEYLTNNKEEYTHLLNYLGHIVQFPGKKISHACLVISRYEGIGKSALERLFRNMLQSPKDEKYVIQVENSQLMSDYTDFMAGKLLCFIHELAQGDRYATMNRLKSLITEDTVSINQKYARAYTIRNTVNFIFFSNLLDAIKIGKHDRRLFVVYNDKEPLDANYYSKLWKTFDEDYYSIFNYLKNLDLSGFNSNSKPPETLGKEQLKEHSQNELSIYLSDCELRGEEIFSKPIVLNELVTHVELNAPAIIKNRVSSKSVQSWLVENDYVLHELDKRVKNVRYRARVYAKKNYVLSNVEIEEILGIKNNKTG